MKWMQREGVDSFLLSTRGGGVLAFKKAAGRCGEKREKRTEKRGTWGVLCKRSLRCLCHEDGEGSTEGLELFGLVCFFMLFLFVVVSTIT